jgi:bacteriocin-associated integral membrane protein
MGWKLIDRYRSLLGLLLAVYSLPFMALLFFAHALFPPLLFAGFTGLDILFVLFLGSKMEKRNVVQLLKGDHL